MTSSSSRIVAVGHVDARGVFGSGFAARRWRDLGLAPLDPTRSWRALFGTGYRTFRRLDLTSRALLVAAEAAGVARHVGGDERRDAAVVVGSALGSLDADLRFQASLAEGREPEAARFPFTLPSAAVGELALRYGLRGPSVFLSLDDDASEPLREARALIEHGDAPAAVAATVEALAEDVAPAGVAAALRATVVVLLRAGR